MGGGGAGPGRNRGGWGRGRGRAVHAVNRKGSDQSGLDLGLGGYSQSMSPGASPAIGLVGSRAVTYTDRSSWISREEGMR